MKNSYSSKEFTTFSKKSIFDANKKFINMS